MGTIENCKYRNLPAGVSCTCPYVIFYDNCCKRECIKEHMDLDAVAFSCYGSQVYGTMTDKSDEDRVVVVPDKYSDYLDKHTNGIFEYRDPDYPVSDRQYMSESTFIKRIKDYDIMSIECLFCEHSYGMEKFSKYFIKNNWKIRESFCNVASNSWVKAHKKMTVEKDLDVYKGQKSLFHCLRILMFGAQLCKYGKIVDFSQANDFWNDIYYNMKDASWEEYKAKYKPIYNKLHSELVKLAPKPFLFEE